MRNHTHDDAAASGLAAPAQLLTPQKQTPGDGRALQERIAEHFERSDCAADADAQRKRLATLQAQLAFIKHELRRNSDGTLVVCRWGMSRPLADLNAAEKFARQVGALHALNRRFDDLADVEVRLNTIRAPA